MNKEKLIEYCKLKRETKNLEKRIDNLRKQSDIVADVVQNGYKGHIKISGIDLKRRYKLEVYETKLQTFYDKLIEELNEIEDYIEKIDQSEIRQILRYKYIDNKNWIQIQFKMRI